MEKYEVNSCYEDMTDKVGGQSMVPVVDRVAERNAYENGRKGWNANGYDQSGMRGEK